MRTTCIHCEQKGVVTELVQTPRGGCCPIHSRDFLAQFQPVKPKPELLGKGVPTRP